MNEQFAPGAKTTPHREPVAPHHPTPSQQSRRAPRSRRRLGLLLAALAVAGAAGAAYYLWAGGNPTAARYTTAAVTRGPILRAVNATGTVNPELTVLVGTYVSGVVQEVSCDYNTQVKKGQICAKIDPRPYQTQVDQSDANLAVAKAQLQKDQAHLTYTQAAFDRAERLIATNSVSKEAHDSARNNFEQAKAQIAFDEATIKQRQAALDAAQVNLEYTNITSPVDGTVVSRNITRGQTVAASFQTPTLFLIATDLTRMQVDTNVSESDIGAIAEGHKVTFSVDAFPRRQFEGVVKQVRQSPQTVQNVVTYDVVVGVENSDLSLKPGMTAASRIVIDQREDVLRVPNAALRYQPDRAPNRNAARRQERGQVYVLRGGEPVPVQVRLGLEDDQHTEIVSGDLKADEQVITAEQARPRQNTMPRMRL